MGGFEVFLLCVILVLIIALMAMAISARQWKRMANMYEEMYLESAEILSDLVVKGQIEMDFGEDLG